MRSFLRLGAAAAALSLLLAPALSAETPEAAADTLPFRQGVDYRIEARLDESTDVLHGRARLRYTNRSSATLDTLWVQQHLNAFRPNSAWARRDLENGQSVFQDLGPDQHAFERFRSVEIDGTTVRPVYPGAPDSTVAGLPLPEPLAPGETATVVMDWDARLSTEARRQGRRGRQFDFAQWYPRIAVYEPDGWKTNPLIRQGEFYGEFGSYDITLEVPEDQVIGATGVPVEGDPGWADAAASSDVEVRHGRDAYDAGSADPLGFLDGSPESGRKRVRWYAEDVHHFAWSASPDYIYESGEYDDVLIHVLYRPGDDDWDDGVAVERTATALDWFDEIWGPYPYRQITNLHRIESGGTEFPMVIMDGSASLGLIVHEVAHQYAHGIFASNEWAEAWLDEGMASFVTAWFFEARQGQDDWEQSLGEFGEQLDANETQPVATHSADFVDYAMYSTMSYGKGSAVLYMLREHVGEDVFREAMREYYDRYRFRHVTEDDLKAVVEDASGEELDWFFEQWLHTAETLDYAVVDAATERAGDGWRTRVTVEREGGIWMPVELHVGDVVCRLDSRDRRFTVAVETPNRPGTVVLDPDAKLLDVDRSNNEREVTGGG
ncbi:MAG: M1 family metallopeptidase [Gemmatimonadota bacterium]